MNRSIPAPSVELARSSARKAKGADGQSLVWNLVAYTGEWRAHGDRQFSLTREIFEQCVTNLRAHPRYTSNWANDLVPWDAGHLSEQPPELQPPTGAAVLGWVRDLEVRAGNGRDELWALSRFTDEGKRQIRDEGRFASIAILFAARDIVSGDDIGATITSIALTPTPALADQPMLIAASRNSQDSHMPDFSSFPGRNSYEKALAFVRAQPGGGDLDYDAAFTRARQIVHAALSHAIDGSTATLEYDPYGGMTGDESIARNPAGKGPAASDYVMPAARFDEFVEQARKLFSDLDDGELGRVASELQVAAGRGYSAGLAGHDWDAAWGRWDLYRDQLLPTALPERHQGSLAKLESAMRSAFETERSASAALRAAGLLDRKPRQAPAETPAQRSARVLSALRAVQADPAWLRRDYDSQYREALRRAHAETSR